MNFKYASAIALATTCLTLPLSSIAQSGSTDSGSQQGAQQPIRGEHEAMKMVRAQAALTETLDEKKVQPGFVFHAKLVRKVQLQNGPELPAGTTLVGQVGTDESQTGSTSKIALIFTEADLKSGTVVPIKATIVTFSRPRNESNAGYPLTPGEQTPNSWKDGTLRVDQIAVFSGVDLHSAIASKNSGVFVSTTDKNVKLNAGSEFALAIASQNGNQASSNTASMNQ